MNLTRRLTLEDYTVAWIAALPIELAAAQAMLDDIHDDLPLPLYDSNSYTFGNIGEHNVVIACLPSGLYGTNSAAVVGSHLQRSFPSIQIGLLVGIGGGVPDRADVRLGDVVVSHEVLQYDFGKTVQSGRFLRTSNSVRPPQILMTTISKLRARHESEHTRIPSFIAEMVARNPFLEHYTYPDSLQDCLFDAEYEHDSLKPDCKDCDKSHLKIRSPRKDTNPKVHYGVVASGNQVLKHGLTREFWSEQENVLCFEMEAAGVMDHFPCLTIRGICDYADSHKSKGWQPYAAAVAAAYGKEFLSVLKPGPVHKLQVSPHTHYEAATPDISNRLDSYQLGAKNLTEKEKQRILDSLKFERIDDRRMAIKNAHADTCQWLLTKDTYLDWQDPVKFKDHHGLLWIKGKPGAGKSTIVKYILHIWLKKNLENAVILSFFFNARGVDLEKSVVGMYRSLLLQLVSENPSLQDVFNSPVIPLSSIDRPVNWTVELLKDLLQQAIERLKVSPVVCFVDALDECDQEQVRDMVSFFEGLGDLSTKRESKVYTCFSSRHYPHITPKLGLQLTLESQDGHQDDIAQYIEKELRIGHSKLATKIKDEVREKASGVFIWVVLVTEILNREYDRGRISALRRRLQEIPRDLHTLFYNILTQEYSQNEDQSQMEEVLLCLQWVLFAKQPLRLGELYFAIQMGVADEPPESWDVDEISLQDMRRFILSTSKGLADATEEENATVQFIHESVRDFLLKDRGLHKIWPKLRNVEGQSHEVLKRSCMGYCSGNVVRYAKTQLQALDSHYIDPGTATPWTKTTEAFPFLTYAVNNLFYHADKAGGFGVPQHEFITNFKLNVWNYFRGIVQNFIDGPFPCLSPSRRLLYVLAGYNTPHLIEACPSAQLCFEKGDERYGLPILQAVVLRSHEAVGAFVREALKRKPLPASVQYIIDNTGKSRVSNVADFIYSPKRSVLSHLAEYGDSTLFALYLEMNKECLNDKDHRGQAPILWASKNGHEAVVKILLDTPGVEPDLEDQYGQTPLYWAARNGHEEIVRSLILSGKANVNSRDNMGQTPLLWAARNGHAGVAKCLLVTGEAETEMINALGQTPLLWASRNRHMEVVRVLLREGNANPNAKDQELETPLSWAIKHNEESHGEFSPILSLLHMYSVRPKLITR
ncbi:Ankyrin repeat domain-containing protein [Paramyrothecium foliicola]|nr:Ankyrin repeat domain-containing protein [Paramyrothecium foliicola]